jgi:hypothetical protein
MKKIDLKMPLISGLTIVSLISFLYVNAPTCDRMLKAQGIHLPTSEEIVERTTTVLPDVEFSKKVLILIKRMLPLHD